MNTIPSFTSMLALALAANPVLGQEKDPSPTAPMAQPPGLRAQRTKPTFVEAKVGPSVALRNEKGQTVGTLRDYLVDAESGTVQIAVVAVEADADSARHSVSFSHFQWHPEERRWVLPMTPEEVRELPLYEPETTDSPLATDGEPDRRELEVSAIAGSEVLAGGDPLGSIERMVLDPNHRTLAFALVAGPKMEEPFVIPWQALSLEGTDEESWTFTAGKSIADLDGAPVLEGDDIETLEEAKRLEQIYAFYGLTPPYPLDS